jgi:hypothetical protein
VLSREKGERATHELEDFLDVLIVGHWRAPSPAIPVATTIAPSRKTESTARRLYGALSCEVKEAAVCPRGESSSWPTSSPG